MGRIQQTPSEARFELKGNVNVFICIERILIQMAEEM